MKTIKYIILIALFVANTLIAYTQTWLWARDGGSNVSAGSRLLTVSPNGNIYNFGGFSGTFTLDCVNMGSAISSGYILCANTNGVFLKGTKITPDPGSTLGTEGGLSVQSLNHDNSGGIYLTGQLNNRVDFGTIETHSFYDGYIAKFNPNLHGLNVKKVSDIVSSIAFDASNNTYAVGSLHTSVSHIDTFSLYNSATNPLFKPKMFLAKLDNLNNCNWVKQSFGGSCGGRCEFNGGNIYVTGRIDSCAIFDTATICPPTKTGQNFIFKLDTLGNILKSFSYPMYGVAPQGISSSFDNNGNTYVFGEIDSVVIIGGQTIHKTAGSQNSAFFAKLDGDFNLIWLNEISSTGSIIGVSTTNGSGFTYIVGTFSGTAIFGNDTVIAQSSKDMFLTRYNTTGNCLGVVTVPNIESSYSIAEDSAGNAIVTGDLKTGTTYFDSIPLTCTGSSNFFLAKLEAITGGANTVRMMRVDDHLVIYANPNTGSFTIEVPQGIVRGNRAQLGIYNSTGGMVKDEAVDISNNRLSIDIGSVQKGIYSVTLSSGQRRYTGRVIIN